MVTEKKLAPAQPKPEEIDFEKAREIIFEPNVGPQTDFLAATEQEVLYGGAAGCLLYTSPSPRDVEESRMPSSA